MTRRRSTALRATMLGAAVVVAACGSDTDGGGGPGTSESAADALTVIATDIAFDAATYELSAGTVELTLVQRGQIPHTLALEDADGNELDLGLAVNSERTEATTTIELESGTYVLWCTIPGHRDLGQEATLAVSTSSATDAAGRAS